MNQPVPRALIAEDEPILAAALTHALQRLWPELDIVATCPNGVEALRQGLALQPDILFLDIKMPGKTGLEAAEELAEQWPDGVPFPHIVFVTAYDEYALAAFEHAAADYVLKPVNDARLGKTVERLRQRLRDSRDILPTATATATATGTGTATGTAARTPTPTPPSASTTTATTATTVTTATAAIAATAATAEIAITAASATAPAGTAAMASGDDNMARLLAQLQAMLPPAPRLQMIRAAVGNSVRMIALADVVYFEALDKYINVVCRDSEALIRTSLKELLPQLDPQQFWQIHRGTIVNASAIASAVRDEAGKLSLTLREHGAQLRVSPLYAHLFRQM